MTYKNRNLRVPSLAEKQDIYLCNAVFRSTLFVLDVGCDDIHLFEIRKKKVKVLTVVTYLFITGRISVVPYINNLILAVIEIK